MFYLTIQTSPWTSIFGWFAFLLVNSFLLYIYFSLTMMIIARKTGTPGAGLAWIPILNLYLICQIARRPGWWLILLLIPVVNLVVLAMLWMSIAEMRGKPAWTGALAVIPFVGMIVPAYLAAGGGVSKFALGARNCQTCGTPIVADESFCRNCGEAAMTVVTARRMPAGSQALIGTGAAFAALFFFGLFGWLGISRVLAYAPPERKLPEMSERTSGTLTEFPVDTDTTAPMMPDSVETEDLEIAKKTDSKTTDSKKQTNKRLPPGVNRENLRTRGTTTLTTTVYRPRGKPVQPNTAEEIYICVLRLTPGQSDKIAVDIVKATNGNRTGAKVQSPRGATYTGSKIQSPQVLIYVLEKQAADVLILIYAPNSSMHDEAVRLAGNVGNGEGLNDYPEIRTSVWTLPQKKPGDLVLIDFYTQNRAEMGFSESDLNAAGSDEETRKLIEYFSQFIPERATHARYQDAARRDWEVAIYDYDSPRRAWQTWFFLNWTIGLSGQSISLENVDGVYADTDEGRALIFQKGPYLIFVLAPAATPTDKLVSLGSGFQV